MEKVVSVIIAVYNAGKTVEECLNSIFAQKYTNTEVIAVNDGSTDNSLEILNEYAKKEKRLKVLSKQNGGPSSARNLGLKNMTGDYFCFVDSDDEIEKDYISEMVKLMDEETCLVSCNYFHQKKNAAKGKVKCKEEEYSGIDSMYALFNDGKHFLITCNKLFRADLLNGLTFNEKIKLNEDTLFNVAYLNANYKNYKTKHTYKKLYNWYITEGSVSDFKISDETVRQFGDTLKAFNKFNIENCEKKVLSIANSWGFMMCVQYIYCSYKVKNKEFFEYFMEFAKNTCKDFRANRKQYSTFRKYATLVFSFEKAFLRLK